MTSRRNNKAATTTETPMYYAMLAPELPVTVMDLEECFTAVPCFGIDDLVIDFPGGGLKISAYQHSVVETDEKRYLIGPSIVFRSGKDGTDVPITVEDIHILQALMVYKSTTLHCGKYNIPAIALD